MNRRRFLRATGISLALPSLEAFAAPVIGGDGPKNFVAIGTYLGWHQDAFFPKQVGSACVLPSTLLPLEKHRGQFTAFSGLDHRAANGHGAWSNFLCGQHGKAYSLDQMIADEIGQTSRFASIELVAGGGEQSSAMSFTQQGVGLPMILRPSVLYKQLFTTAEDRARSEYLLRSGRSALDYVLVDAKRLHKSLPHSDQQKLNEYFDSVRGVEKRIQRQLATINQPVAQPDYKLPNYDPITPNLQLEAETIMYELMALALETESTRVLSMFINGLGQVFTIDGRTLRTGYYGLSHHGNDPDMLSDLLAVENSHMRCLSGFLNLLKTKKNAQGKSLLDDTIVLVGTGMGDASRHSNRNLPTLVAGGGFNHQSHVAIDRKAKNVPLLGDLYLTIMQRLGIEAEQFSNAKHNMNQLFS